MADCPICRTGHRVKFRYSNGQESFYRCSDCELMFIHPLPGYKSNKKLYDEISQALYVGQCRLQGDFSSGALAMHRRRLQWLLAFKQSGRLCEIGCSTGSFLRVARDEGFEVAGVELSTPSAEYSRDKLGLAVRTGTIHDAAYPRGSFDAVYSWHTLEHVWNPNEVVAEIWRILKPGGIAVLGVPNGACLSLRLTGHRYPHVHRGHLLYFSPSSMTAILRKHMFRIERLWTIGWDKVALLRGLRLINLRQRPEAYEELTVAQSELSVRWHKPGLLPLRVPLAPLNPLVERLGLGDDLICIAKKGANELTQGVESAA